MESNPAIRTEMRATIYSIHSQVPAAIAREKLSLDTIVSMDSHLDVSLGGDEELYPKDLQIVVARTGVHTAFRHMIGGISALKTGARKRAPNVTVIISRAMLAKHVSDVESKLPSSIRLRNQEDSILSSLDFLERTMGIGVYQSPPKSLRSLARDMRKTRSWLLDIDVDCMREMQNECYTKIFNPGRGVLQSMVRVLEFIEKSRPEAIAISEAKVSAMRDANSNFSTFIRRLRSMGYGIEEGDVFASDFDVVRNIAVCKEFYRTVSKHLLNRHMEEMMRGELQGFHREQATAAKRFFTERGYAF